MIKPHVLVLRAPGANCNVETAFAFERAGAEVETLHVNRLLEAPSVLQRFQVLCIPGGFSYGDDLSAGRILGNQLRLRLAEAMREFHAAGKLILGICNGFQILMKTGLLLADESDAEGRPALVATLAWNATGRFEDRWLHLQTAPSSCVFFRGIERMYLPIAHAEGRFTCRDERVVSSLFERQQVVLQYDEADNVNGSQQRIAGVCDESGRVCGLMPHPERHIDRTHHPRWTRGEGSPGGGGLKVFENAVEFFAA